MTEKNRIYIKLLLLLGGRKGELIEAEKTHFDLRSGIWTVPIEVRKMGEQIGAPILRPLIKPAIQLIDLAMQMSKSNYLFPVDGRAATNGFDTTIPYNVRVWASRYHGTEMEHWSMHDLRRTMRTRMSAITTKPTLASREIGIRRVSRFLASARQIRALVRPRLLAEPDLECYTIRLPA
jgi:integrase